MMGLPNEEDDSDNINDYEMWDEYEGVPDSEFDEYEEFNWFEEINGKIHPKQANNNNAARQDPVGFCESALIRRDGIRAAFYHEIEEPTEETSAMGFDLFDRYGRLKPAFKKHASKSGSGIWGNEIDTGDIHLIEQVIIDESQRRKGLGKMLLESILERGIAKSNPHRYVAIARIAVLSSEFARICEGKTDEERREISDGQRHIAQLFLRSVGFRRIGWTEWFALAGDEEHPCHSLPADQDFDPPRTLPSIPDSIMNTLMRDLKTIETDEARLDAIQKALGGCMPDDSAWTATDVEGNTLLHLLANSDNPTSVKWVLSACPKLADIRNSEGNTPLGTFEEHLENTRTQRRWMALVKPVSDKFSGYSEAAVETLAAMKGLANPGPLDLLRLQYGCTCGQCQGGILSPRMRFVLIACAETEHETLLDDVFMPDGDTFVEMNKELLEYLPAHVRDNLRTNKSMREGFANLFRYFAKCLKENRFPVREAILDIWRRTSEWPPVTRNYLERGGTVEAAGSALFESTMQTSLWAGDGMTEDTFGEDIARLPACRNDDEFGFVSGMCGYKRVCRVRYVSMSGEPIDD
jgi:GNAT superfamily N-acetyltransferase